MKKIILSFFLSSNLYLSAMSDDFSQEDLEKALAQSLQDQVQEAQFNSDDFSQEDLKRAMEVSQALEKYERERKNSEEEDLERPLAQSKEEKEVKRLIEESQKKDLEKAMEASQALVESEQLPLQSAINNMIDIVTNETIRSDEKIVDMILDRLKSNTTQNELIELGKQHIQDFSKKSPKDFIGDNVAEQTLKDKKEKLNTIFSKDQTNQLIDDIRQKDVSELEKKKQKLKSVVQLFDDLEKQSVHALSGKAQSTDLFEREKIDIKMNLESVKASVYHTSGHHNNCLFYALTSNARNLDVLEPIMGEQWVEDNKKKDPSDVNFNEVRLQIGKDILKKLDQKITNQGVETTIKELLQIELTNGEFENWVRNARGEKDTEQSFIRIIRELYKDLKPIYLISQLYDEGKIKNQYDFDKFSALENELDGNGMVDDTKIDRKNGLFVLLPPGQFHYETVKIND
jgi:hypothetical protein